MTVNLNRLGKTIIIISTIYLFMFLFSLIGNGMITEGIGAILYITIVFYASTGSVFGIIILILSVYGYIKYRKGIWIVILFASGIFASGSVYILLFVPILM